MDNRPRPLELGT